MPTELQAKNWKGKASLQAGSNACHVHWSSLLWELGSELQILWSRSGDWGKWVAFESDCLAEILSVKLQSLVMINIIALTNLTMLRCVLINTCATYMMFSIFLVSTNFFCILVLG